MTNATPIGLNETILYGSFIKYDRLQDLTVQNLSYSSSSELNVFIDMYSLLLPLYRNNVRVIQDTGIAACIVKPLCSYTKLLNECLMVNTSSILSSTNAPDHQDNLS